VNREQLAHVLRAACTVANEPNVLVLGSQSILGSFGEDELPPEATASIEADIAFLNDTDRQKADRVDGAIGELSAFHDTNGVYAEGVHRRNWGSLPLAGDDPARRLAEPACRMGPRIVASRKPSFLGSA
jgi:hypothetical protein